MVVTDAVATFLAEHKARLAGAKLCHVPALAERAVSHAMAALESADLSQQTLQ